MKHVFGVDYNNLGLLEGHCTTTEILGKKYHTDTFTFPKDHKFARINFEVLDKSNARPEIFNDPRFNRPSDFKVGDVFRFANLKLRVVLLEDNFYDSLIVAQANDHTAWMLSVLWRAQNFLRRIKYRTIITAHVWGLGKRDRGAYPCWKDVYVINKLDQRIRSIFDFFDRVTR